MRTKEAMQAVLRDAKRDAGYAAEDFSRAEDRVSRANYNLECADIAEDLAQAVIDVGRGLRSFDELVFMAEQVRTSLGVM